MAAKSASALDPIRRAISVSWDQEAAFRRFTADFAKWWPSYALSIGGSRIARVVFECRVGGVIYEEHRDGTRFQWGKVLELDAPRRVVIAWHSSRDESDAQRVEVTFVPERTGTRVELVSSGWEKLSAKAKGAYGGYQMSWRAAIEKYADRFSMTLALFGVMSATMTGLGMRNSFIRGSRGRMPAAIPEEKPLPPSMG
jgi:uncharacterized protein YndB with AHSA1/START domain